MRLFQVINAQGRICPGALTGGRAEVATAGQAGFATTLDLLAAEDHDGLDLTGWFDEQRRAGITSTVDWAALEATGKSGDYRLTIRVAGAADQVIQGSVSRNETDTHTFQVG